MQNSSPTPQQCRELDDELVEHARDALNRWSETSSAWEIQAAHRLLDLAHHVDMLAWQEPEVLQGIWPYLLEIVEGLSRGYYSFERGRALERAWELELGETDGWGHRLGGRPTESSRIASDLKELWQVGNQALARFKGKDPGQTRFAREFLRLKGVRVLYGEHSNPARSLLRRSDKLLGFKGGYEGLISFLRGPEPLC